MAENNIGKITQVIGAVIDIKFTDGNLPEINSAINIKTNDGGKLVVEVAQHLGDDVVRCIAMGPTDGLVRGMDALTHAIESYITPGAWAMSDMFELKAIEMIAVHLKAAVDNGSDPVAREAMSQAQYIAGMGFSNVGLGIVHSMAHPLGAHYDTPHGVANALLLPYVMEYNAASPAAPKYVHIAKAMGVNTEGMSVEEGICAAIDAVRKLSLSIGIPQRLREINVREEDLHQLAIDAFNDVCTGGNPRPTSVEDIEALYHKAF